MEYSHDEQEKIRKTLEQNNKRSITDFELKQTISFITMLAEMAIDITEIEFERKKKLETSPKGFHLDGGGHTCMVCHSIVAAENSWYDSYGIKCMACQTAINNKIIPPTLCQKPDSYYTEFDLDHCFALKGKILNSWIKGGLIVARLIPGLSKGIHTRLFLLKDNKEFLPPKYLVTSQRAVEEKDGKKEYLFGVPWYRMLSDPIAHLKGYGIAAYLKRIDL